MKKISFLAYENALMQTHIDIRTRKH